MDFSLVVADGGCSLVVVRGLLGAVACLVRSTDFAAQAGGLL